MSKKKIATYLVDGHNSPAAVLSQKEKQRGRRVWQCPSPATRMVLSPITSLGKRQARYDFDVRIRLSLSESAFKRPAPRKIPADHQRSSLVISRCRSPSLINRAPTSESVDELRSASLQSPQYTSASNAILIRKVKRSVSILPILTRPITNLLIHNSPRKKLLIAEKQIGPCRCPYGFIRQEGPETRITRAELVLLLLLSKQNLHSLHSNLRPYCEALRSLRT